MAELENLFNSPPGQSSRPPRPRTPSPSPSPTSTPARKRLSSQPLFLSPNGTATPVRRHPQPPAQRQRQEEIRERLEVDFGVEPELDPFEESVTTGNLGVYDPLAPILGDEEPARKKRKPIPKIDAER